MRMIVGAACGLLCLATTAAPTAATAQTAAEPAVVVELFTSQGCSSCPPADELLAMMAADPSVITLALHVDYWDYLGWEDRFADARFTARQKAYAHAEGSGTIYTPQMIIGGADRVVGYRPDEIGGLVAAHLQAARPVALTVTREGDTVHIRAEANPPLQAPVRVQLVRYSPSETVEIKRGENAGKTVTYRNIVTAWDHVGDWAGTGPLDMVAPAPGDAPLVVILQNEGPAAIQAAVRLD